MTNDGLDPRYPDYRDHAALKERVTKLEASLLHLPNDVAEMRRKQDGLEAKLDTVLEAVRGLQRPPQDTSALALHHLADALSKGGKGGQNPALLLAAGVGCISIGGWLVKLLGLS